ncbi:Uncharacterised protein [Legionella wadsworthii]|uniref:Uncharacterized protein n=1 Tax=Legionella wadsworthii TaxID=28088 RepID=A0A378LMU6_9GAMM|nr:hypothetical protein [Legionella wadsworthii]STY28335.1 Uncharacterised protein [Legionella wadsworthii]
MKMAAEMIVEYLEHVSEALINTAIGGKDVGELFSNLNGRLFFTPSMGNIQIKEPTQLLEVLCEDKVIETFGELFNQWKPRVNEMNLTQTKETFYRFFFEPIEQNEVWQIFWTKQVQLIAERVKAGTEGATEEEIKKEIQKIHDQIASAVIYRIQQSWLSKQNKLITEDLASASSELEQDEILERRNLLTAKVAVFTTIINNSWNSLDQFLGSETNPEKGTIYFDFNDEMKTLEKNLGTRCIQIAQMKKGFKQDEEIRNFAANIHGARQSKGYRNLGEGVNESKLQTALRIFVTQLMDDPSSKGKLVLEIAARGILEDITMCLTKRKDAVNSQEYSKTIRLLSAIGNKQIRKQCKELSILCGTKRDSVRFFDKSDDNEVLSYSLSRERTETISEPTVYSPPQSPRPTHRHTLQQSPAKEKSLSLLEKFFGKKEDKNKSSFKNLSFSEGVVIKEIKKMSRSSTSFFKTHDDKKNQPSSKSTLSPGLD